MRFPRLTLVIFAPLNLILANSQPRDLFAPDDFSTEVNSDDIFGASSNLDSLKPDPYPGSIVTTSELSDFSNSNAEEFPNLNSYDEFLLAADPPPLGSPCDMGSNVLFDDNTFAGDGTLQARDEDGALCQTREKAPPIDLNLDLFKDPEDQLRNILSPLDINIPAIFGKPKQPYRIPPDPPGDPIKEYGKCFLPFETRCCCQGFYLWGPPGIWGLTIDQILDCSACT